MKKAEAVYKDFRQVSSAFKQKKQKFKYCLNCQIKKREKEQSGKS